MDARVLNICHVITSTGVGGAETQLLRLLEALGPGLARHRVISLLPLGPLAPAMERAGARVESLELAPGPKALLGARALRRRLLAWPADLIQTWMYHADLLGFLASPGLGRPLLWTLRCADLSRAGQGRATAWVVRACAALSRLPRPEAIVANSQSGLEFHRSRGYRAAKLRLIPNGFDTALYAPDPARGSSLRARLGWGPQTLVVGHVARHDPAKDHATFLKAAGLLAARLPQCRFLLMGQGVEDDAPAFAACHEPPLLGRCRLLGRQDEVPAWLNAMDVFVQSSLSEGLPNALGEAMAAGLPVVATRAGDSALMLGEDGQAGRLVPVADAPALAQALEELLLLGPQERARLGLEASRRLARGYSLEAMAQAYLDLYRRLAQGPKTPALPESTPPEDQETPALGPEKSQDPPSS